MDVPTAFTSKDQHRLLSKVVAGDNGCLIFTGGLSSGGYGRFWLVDSLKQAHRASYQMFVGPIPDGLTIDHLCRNTRCVRPDHLEPVTMRENILRGRNHVAGNVRKTHCPQGHPYDEENTMVCTRDGRSRRYCRACQSKRKIEARRARRAA